MTEESGPVAAWFRRRALRLWRRWFGPITPGDLTTAEKLAVVRHYGVPDVMEHLNADGSLDADVPALFVSTASVALDIDGRRRNMMAGDTLSVARPVVGGV